MKAWELEVAPVTTFTLAVWLCRTRAGRDAIREAGYFVVTLVI